MQFELVSSHEAGPSVESDRPAIVGCNHDVCGVGMAGGHLSEEGGDQLLADAPTLVRWVDGNGQELDAPARPRSGGGTVPEGLERPAPPPKKGSHGVERGGQTVAEEKG